MEFGTPESRVLKPSCARFSPNYLKMTLFLQDPPNQHTFLVEYRGEGGNGNDEGCSNVDQMSECSTTWDCKCQDSSNNTYACVRTVSSPGNTIFCKFEDDVGFEEMYNIEQV